MSLLEQDIIKRGKGNDLHKPKFKLTDGNDKEYEVEAISKSTTHVNETERDQLPELYYLIP